MGNGAGGPLDSLRQLADGRGPFVQQPQDAHAQRVADRLDLLRRRELEGVLEVVVRN